MAWTGKYSTADTFRTPDLGMLGYMQDNKPHFYRASTRPNTADTEFDVSGLDKLPQVDIVYAYGNYNSIALDAFAHFTGVQASRLTKLWRLFPSHSGTDCTRGTYGFESGFRHRTWRAMK